MLATPASQNLRRLALVATAVTALGVLALAGCSKNDKKNPVAPGGGGGPTTTTFVGTFSSGTKSGKLTVTVSTTSLARRWDAHRAAGAVVNATGTCVLDGATTNLTGTYDPASDAVAVAGGGYSFDGTFDPTSHSKPVMEGTWTGPLTTSGEFVCTEGANTAVSVYTGYYFSTTSPPDSGTFSFSVEDSILSGMAHGSGSSSPSLYFEGKVRGTSNPRTIAINFDGGAYTLSAPGTLNTTTGAVSGTYTATDVAGGGATDDGTYTGHLTQ